MQRMVVAASVFLPLFLLTACQGEQAATLQPVEAPLAPGAAASEILPLESVAKSQAGAVAQRVANTVITVTYNRPVARGRELFGALVPYEQVWNPGADQATAISFSRNVEVGGHPLPAGKYSIWAIPRPDRWTMIFSRAADVFHTPYPGEDQDALRIDARPEPGAHMETLSFYFPVVEGKDAVLRLHWGAVVVPIALRVP